MEQHYINKKRKIVDFLIGMIGLPLAQCFLLWIASIAMSSELIWALAIASLLFFVLILAKKRYFIFIGYVSVLIIPVTILFGACGLAFLGALINQS